MATHLKWILPGPVVAMAGLALAKANYVLSVAMIALFFLMDWVHRNRRS